MLCNECHGVQGPQGPYLCHCGKKNNYYHEWAENFANLVAGKIRFYEPKNFVDTKDVVLELLLNMEHLVKDIVFKKEKNELEKS